MQPGSGSNRIEQADVDQTCRGPEIKALSLGERVWVRESNRKTKALHLFFLSPPVLVVRPIM
jgi:hypothetical protein